VQGNSYLHAHVNLLLLGRRGRPARKAGSSINPQTCYIVLFALCFTLGIPTYAQREAITTQVKEDIHSNKWQVRRDAFEHISAIHLPQSQAQIQTLLIDLRDVENDASAKSDPDLFEDDEYLAYDDKLTARIQSIAVETSQRKAWDALVNMRFNPDSEYAGWLAQHEAALPSLEELLKSAFVPRRVNAVYIIAEILSRDKQSHHLNQSEYDRLKSLIKWHAVHDEPQVSAFSIQGIGLTHDLEDISFLDALLPSIKDDYRRKLILEAKRRIRGA
jgi:hypothetical protein